MKRVQYFLWKESRPLKYSPDCIPRTQDMDAVYEKISGFTYTKGKASSKKTEE